MSSPINYNEYHDMRGDCGWHSRKNKWTGKTQGKVNVGERNGEGGLRDYLEASNQDDDQVNLFWNKVHGLSPGNGSLPPISHPT